MEWQSKRCNYSFALWERGLINAMSIKQYPLTGKKVAFGGVVDYGTSLRHLVGLCHDFIKEEGMLQHIAKVLSLKSF
jgi:hypothetical protein